MIKVGPLKNVAAPIAYHPDLIYCKLGKTVFHGTAEMLGNAYPEDVKFNACSTGRYFIHNTGYTHPLLLEKAIKMEQTVINVSQGYAKCSVVEVNEDSIITYDRGIAVRAEKAGMNVLMIRPGWVELPGYPTGFIGGASGLVGKQLIFNGDLSAHPDYMAMRDFIEKRGIECVYFKEYPLTDIGSIVEERTNCK